MPRIRPLLVIRDKLVYNIFMKLIFALGNPGSQYTKTRHNIGWLVLDAFANSQKADDFQLKPKFFAETTEFSYESDDSVEKVILAKPTTFYNETGKSARALMDFYKLSLDDILVVHDDTMLDFGKIRVRRGGRDAGNNGLKSLHRHIGSGFWHIRIGTDALIRRQIGDTDFVLSKFNRDEQLVLQESILPKASQIISDFIADKLEPTSYSLPR